LKVLKIAKTAKQTSANFTTHPSEVAPISQTSDEQLRIFMKLKTHKTYKYI